MSGRKKVEKFCDLKTREEVMTAFRKSRDPLKQLLATGKAIETGWGDVCIDDVRFGAEDIRDVVMGARAAQLASYAPYSHFNVGAAIRTPKGKIIQGCNVENAAYGSTVCAERTAAFSAVAQGEREFSLIGIVGGFDFSVPKTVRDGTKGTYIFPCGCCRQVLNEFGGGDLGIVLATEKRKVLFSLLKYMLPGGFGPETLSVNPQNYSRKNRR